MDSKKGFLKIEIALTEFCGAKMIKFTPEAIKFQSAMLIKRFSHDAILKALNDLFYETRFFPDASLIADKIKKNCKVGNSKALATQEVNRILEVIRNCGFDSANIESAIGKGLYSAIGGFDTVRSYGMATDRDISTLKAQMRDAIEPMVAKKASYELLKKSNAVAVNNNKIDYKEDYCVQSKIRD